MRPLVLCLIAITLAAAETWTLPNPWGQAQGNPIAVEGQPRWRLDQIFPANPEDAQAYRTLAWDQGRSAWFNEAGSQGGQPDAKVAGGNLIMGVRARGGGSVDYVKGAALVFIAPKDGRYRFDSGIDIHRWEGGTTTRLRALRRFPKADAWSVEPLGTWPLTADKGQACPEIVTDLKAGEELAIVPWHDGHWSGATVTLVAPRVMWIGAWSAGAADLSPVAAFAPERSAGRPLPPHSGCANVRDYGAKGDGITDDTAAIQRAITENRNKGGKVVYLPAGTYLVSDTLSYGDNLEQAKFLTIQGQGREQTVIRLKDACPGYDRRKAVLSQFEGKTTGMAFNNSVYDLTIDVGSGNPGAVALEWMNNNSGSCERVTLRSSDPERVGLVGFDLTRHEPGPGLVRDLVIEGFDWGVESTKTCFSMTFEGLTLRHQRKAGIHNNTQSLFLRNVVSDNAVPAIICSDKTPYGMTAVFDATFTGSDAAKDTSAIIAGTASLTLRNVRQAGYARLVDLSAAKQGNLEGAAQQADWWPALGKASSPVAGQQATMLNLPIEESPDIPWDTLDRWAVVNPERIKADYDDSLVIQEALQWAVANGKTSLLVPGGLGVRFGTTIVVPPEIQRIHGMDAMCNVTPDLARGGGAVWRVDNGAEPLVIERFFLEDFSRQHAQKNHAWIEHGGQRTLVFGRGGIHGNPYRGLAAATNAKVFIEDITGADLRFTGQRVWMRQWNPESNGVMATNDGGTLWILGTKTECETGTWVHTTGGGRTEILGAYTYPSWRNPKSKPPKPLFTVDQGSSLSVSGMKEQTFHGYMQYPVIIRFHDGSQTFDLGRSCFIANGFVPLIGVRP